MAGKLNLLKKKLKPTNNAKLSEDERNLAILDEARKELEALLIKHKIDLGLWITKSKVEELHKLFQEHPGIQVYKLEAQLRKG